MPKKKKHKFTQEELTQKLLASREKVEKNREELARRGYSPKDIQIIKFMQKPTANKAIRFNCWECQGYSWAEAKACKNKTCPLYCFAFGRGKNKKEVMEHYQKHMVEVNELNPNLDYNVDFANLFGDDEDAD